jgi:hypothetical protein
MMSCSMVELQKAITEAVLVVATDELLTTRPRKLRASPMRDMNRPEALKAVSVDPDAILSRLTASRRHGGRDRRNPSMFLDWTRPDKVGAKSSPRAFEVRGPAINQWACGEVLQYRRGCTTGRTGGGR